MEVLLEVVAFTPVKFWRVVEPEAARVLTIVAPVVVWLVEVEFTKLALLAYRLVEVELEVVALVPVKFCSVVEPITSKEEVAMREPAMLLPCKVVEAREAEEVAVRVPIVALPPVRRAMVALPMVAKVEVMVVKRPVTMLPKEAKKPPVVEVAVTVVEPKVA